MKVLVPGVNIAAVLPEIIMTAGGMLVLVLGSGLRKKAHLALGGLSLLIAAGAGVAAAIFGSRHEVAFAGTVAIDGFSTFLRLVLIGSAGVAILASYEFVDDEQAPATEVYGLTLFATAGMMLMVSALDLMMVFIALETFSLAFYVMTALRKNRLDSQEGALKYFLSGSFASGFFLYGVALIYGGTGSTRFLAIAQSVTFSAGEASVNPLVLSGLALVLVGLAFKVAAVPFHMWTPDVYQGAPAPITGFMAAGSKVAGFAVLLRLLIAVFPSIIQSWEPIVTALAIVSMLLGSIVAVAQTNVKRMLAYSAIAHSGFLLIGVVSANARGISASVFYLGIYSFVILACFAVVYALGGPGEEKVSLSDYRGLWSRSPFLSSTFALLLISLAGIPPTAGFMAKFEIFSAGIAAGHVPLVVVGVLSSSVAAFFYLRVIVLMFLQEEADWQGAPSTTAPALGAAVLIGVGVVMIAGVFPSPILELARDATFVFR